LEGFKKRMARCTVPLNRGCVQFDEPISKPVVVLDRSIGLISLTRILSGDFSTHDYP